METQTMEVEAQFLRKGDYLVMTQSVVVQAPSAGLKTPKGKVDLVVQSISPKTLHKQYAKLWGKNTKITIKREVQPSTNQIPPDNETDNVQP